MENDLLAFLNELAQKYAQFYSFYSEGEYEDLGEAVVAFLNSDPELAEIFDTSNDFTSAMQEVIENNARQVEEIMAQFFGDGFFGYGPMGDRVSESSSPSENPTLRSVRDRLEQIMKQEPGKTNDPPLNDGEDSKQQ